MKRKILYSQIFAERFDVVTSTAGLELEWRPETYSVQGGAARKYNTLDSAIGGLLLKRSAPRYWRLHRNKGAAAENHPQGRPSQGTPILGISRA